MKKRAVVLPLILLLSLLLCACSDGSVTVGDLPDVSTPEAVSVPEATAETESPTGVTKPPSMADTTRDSISDETPEEATASTDSEIILGRNVFVHKSGVAFWGAEEALCSALLDENGVLYDPYVEAELPDYIWSIAIVDDDCYLSTGSGFYRLNLTDFSEGSAVMEQLCDITMYDGFSIFEGQVYFLDGSDLYRLSLADASLELILSNVSDFELTTDRIYCTSTFGGLYQMPYDGTDKQLLADTDTYSHLQIWNDTAIFWGRNDTEPRYYDLYTGEYGYMALPNQNSYSSALWFIGDELLYTLSDGDVQRCDLVTGACSDEDHLYLLPEKHEGTQVGEMLYYSYASTVYWANLQEGWRDSYAISDFAVETQSQPPEDAVTSATTSTSDYNISAGLDIVQVGDMAVLSTDHFTMELPASISWSMRVVDEYTLQFFHTQAEADGYGGVFLTIHALDVGDDRYLDWPDYSTLGISNGKQYIATRPTDVQFNTTDAAQAEEYRQLLFHANLFYEFELDNPFTLK